MKITTRILLASALLLGSAPLSAQVAPEAAAVEELMQAIPAAGLSVSGNNVRITNAAGLTLEVYNITGVRTATYKIDSNDKTLTLNLPKSCYILKVGKIVRKVSVL